LDGWLVRKHWEGLIIKKLPDNALVVLENNTKKSFSFALPLRIRVEKDKVFDPYLQFYNKKNGTVVDKKTNLQWMRCSLGQAWSGGTCKGKATKYSWKKALDQAKMTHYAGYSDWRVPTLKELQSLVVCSNGKTILFDSKGNDVMSEGGYGCNRLYESRGYKRPTIIDSAVFPNTPDSPAWSSSPGAYDDRGRGVSFYFGESSYSSGYSHSISVYVR
jgi:hypothetical protein